MRTTHAALSALALTAALLAGAAVAAPGLPSTNVAWRAAAADADIGALAGEPLAANERQLLLREVREHAARADREIGDGKQAVVLKRLQPQLDGLCPKVDTAEGQRAACRALLKPAANKSETPG